MENRDESLKTVEAKKRKIVTIPTTSGNKRRVTATPLTPKNAKENSDKKVLSRKSDKRWMSEERTRSYADSASEDEALARIKRSIDFPIVNLMRMAERARKMDSALLMTFGGYRGLKEMSTPSVVEVQSVKERQTVTGVAYTIEFIYEDQNKKQCVAKTCVPRGVMDTEVPVKFPHVLVYYLQTSDDDAEKQTKSFYRIDCGGEADRVKETARDLRTLSEARLKRFLSFSTLSSFEPDTLFTLDSLKRFDFNDASNEPSRYVVGRFTSKAKGKSVDNGELILLSGYAGHRENDLRPCVMHYRGLIINEKGRNVYDLRTLSL